MKWVRAMIPLQVPFKIRPEINDPCGKSVSYIFSDHDIVEHAYDYTLYRVPHSPCTYWTNFQFTTEPNSDLSIELLMITEDGSSCSITSSDMPIEWHTTFWALPSIHTTDQSGFYFKVHYKTRPDQLPRSISLVGFIDLFPAHSIYCLLGNDGACQFIVCKSDLSSYEKNKPQTGTIRQMTLEQKKVKIEDSIPIRPISQYH
jgi:hypothetical protein